MALRALFRLRNKELQSRLGHKDPFIEYAYFIAMCWQFYGGFVGAHVKY